ncbi:10979_t:CDS:2, partial [Ambispora leptoticha]
MGHAATKPDKVIFRIFAQIRKEINSRLSAGGESSTIADATSHHAIRQASLKEAYTSTTNMWKGDIYSKSLRNVIRILLRIHLAPIKMARNREIRQWKARAKQMKRKQGNPSKRRRNQKHQTSRLMNELGMAVINNRPTFVVQRIAEKLQQSLDTPFMNLEEIQNEGELNELDMAIYTATKNIRALLAIVRMLVESGKIRRGITSDDIQCAAFRGTVFTEREKAVSAKIADFLRPFVQQRMDDNKPQEPHILARAPLAALANAIVTVAGFPSLIRKLSITSSQDSRALHLTAAGVYDAFHGQWDIPVDDRNWITNSYQAGKNKSTAFGAFFNMNKIESKIESLMKSYKLEFGWKLIFVNKWTVRLLGKAIPGKKFITSNYEARKKRGNYVAYTPITDKTPMKRTDTETAADKLAEVKSLTRTLRSLRRELSPLELDRINIGRKVRRSSWDPGSEDYSELKKIRQEIAAKRLKIINLEKTLQNTTVAVATNTVTDISAAKEDKIELMDLLPIILEHRSSGRKVVFAGTDPGIVTTSTTISRTLEEVFADINRFHILSTEDGSNVETTLYLDGVQQLPRPSKITTRLIDNATFKRCHQKKHQRMEASSVSPGIKKKKLAKNRREREVRTKQAYSKITAQERKHIRAHAQPSPGDNSLRLESSIASMGMLESPMNTTPPKRVHTAFRKSFFTGEGCTLKRRNRMCQPSVPLKDDKLPTISLSPVIAAIPNTQGITLPPTFFTIVTPERFLTTPFEKNEY